MSLPDLINVLFESAGSLAVAMSCLRLYKDKQVHGLSTLTAAFFTSWGFWNLYYYPSLGQFWSGLAAGLVCLVNATWLGMIFYYRKYPGGRRLSLAKDKYVQALKTLEGKDLRHWEANDMDRAALRDFRTSSNESNGGPNA